MNSYLGAILSGVVLGLAWVISPFFAFVGFVYMLFLRTKLTSWQYAKHCFLFFWTWNAVASSWMLMGYVGLGLLFFSIIAPLMTLPLWLACRMKQGSAYFFVVFWLAYEYGQYQSENLWSWLTLGNCLATLPEAIQWYEYTGVLGGSCWILISNVLIFKAIEQYPVSKTTSYASAVACVLLCGLAYGTSWWIMPSPSAGKELNVVVVQPNIDIGSIDKLKLSNHDYGRLIMDLAKQKISPSTDLVLFHEGLFAKSFEISGLDHPNNYREWDTFKSFLHQYPQTTFVFGMYLHRWVHGKERQDATTYFYTGDYVKYYNAAVLYQKDKPRQYYFKSKRVPLGESVPLLPHWAQALVTSARADLTPSERPNLLVAPKAKIGAVICYESIYGDYVRRFSLLGADLLCIIAEDGFWYGSNQPHQHFAIDCLRAIENRRAILRAGSVGFSGLIDATGKAVHIAHVYKREALAFAVPIGEPKQTFYMRWGDWVGILACILAGLGIIFVYFRKRIH